LFPESEYSAVEHLAYALWPDGCFSESHFMMFTGYFDDSGHVTNNKVLVVAGFVAPVGQWKMFEKDWRAILKHPRFDLDYLHMKEFRNYRGKFAKFKNNLPLQTDLFSNLYELIEARAEQSFGGTVLLRDYESVNSRYQLQERYGHPFAMAGMVSMNQAIRWMEREHPNDRLKFVFDHDTDGWGHLLAAAKETWIDEVIPVPGTFKEQLPLQAADNVAWEKHRFMTQAVDKDFAPGSIPLRGSLDALIRKFQPQSDDESATWHVLNEENLETFCLESDIDKRV
jgi:hypothetical protein